MLTRRRSLPARGRAVGVLLAGGLLAPGLTPGPAAAAQGTLRLPAPGDLDVTDLLRDVGARPDRVLRSVVPGPVRNAEVVRTEVDGSGAPVAVRVEQRLLLTGTGDYQVRERGPARQAVALGEEPAPVTKFGAVVWQGFSPGRRTLAALLTLDPALEAPRLPMAVALWFTPPGGSPRPLGPGGGVPGAGTVTVRLTSRTAQPADLPTAADAPAGPVARALDVARRQARSAAGPRLPTAGGGLPTSVPASDPTTVASAQAVPLRVTGRLTGSGLTVVGPGTTPRADGAALAGTLASAPVELTVTTTGPTSLGLDLQAVPALDPRALVPPAGASSWAAWAAGSPVPDARRAALDLLVRTAASGARATAWSPYLGAGLPGTGSTAFRWTFSPQAQLAAAAAPVRPRRGVQALVGVAAALLVAAGAGLWRLS